MCHLHRDAQTPGSLSVRAGPDLTGRRYPAAYLSAFLANPAAVTRSGGETAMPDLQLEPTEINSLVAFINTARQAAR